MTTYYRREASEIKQGEETQARSREDCILYLFCIVFYSYFVSIIFKIQQIVFYINFALYSVFSLYQLYLKYNEYNCIHSFFDWKQIY